MPCSVSDTGASFSYYFPNQLIASAIDVKSWTSGQTLPLYAAGNDHVTVVRQLLDSLADIDAKDNTSRRAVVNVAFALQTMYSTIFYIQT